MGGDPIEIPWAFDQFSAHQLAADPAPSADYHGVAFPEHLPTMFAEEAATPFNASTLPSVIINGGLDNVAPAPVTGPPFHTWISQLGYTTRYVLYPTERHSPTKRPDVASAYDVLSWLEAHPKDRAPREIAYQSSNLVEPERGGVYAWPFFRPTGALEGRSMPLQGVRQDRTGGVVLEDPWRYRIRLAFRSDTAKRWDGTLRLDGGRIVSASAIDDGVGITGRAREVPGSAAVGIARRIWLEPDDSLATDDDGVRFAAATSTTDPWDMITLEVEALPDAVLRVASDAFPEGERQYALGMLRRSAIDTGEGELPRTFDDAVADGAVRMQVLQSRSWWWSQIRVLSDADANAATVWLRNLAGARLDLAALGLDPGSPLTVELHGAREFTGDFVLTLEGDWSSWSGEVRRDGVRLDSNDASIDGQRMRLPAGDVAGQTIRFEFLPSTGTGAPAPPPLRWRDPTPYVPTIELPEA